VIVIRGLFLSFLLSGIAGCLYATHIVGGDITYRHLGNDMYRIQVYLYVDCINGTPLAIDQDIESKVGVFENGTDYPVQTLDLTRSGPQRISAVNYSCVIPPTNACVDLYIFETTTNIPPSAAGYELVFQRCCRNGTINNLLQPESTGSTYRTFIPPASGKNNNSAKFKGLPPNFLCVNEPLSFDHSAEDADGDSLVYSVCEPLHGASREDPIPHPADFPPPFRNIQWRVPYNALNQMGGSPLLTIDPVSGLLEVTPGAVGQFVVGICVSEYRNGELINTVLRDFQFNVSRCVFDVKSNFSSGYGVCSDTVTFTNTSAGTAESFRWDFGIEEAVSDTSAERHTAFVFPGPGTYTVTLEAKKGNCSSKIKKDIVILEREIPGLFKDSVACQGDRIRIGMQDDDSRISYAWSPPEGLDDPTVPNPLATVTQSRSYVVRKSSPSCYVEQEVSVIKDPLKADFVHEYLPPCDGLRVRYYSRNQGSLSHEWDFGDRSTAADRSAADSAAWFYQDSGIVYVKMKAFSARCVDSVVKPIRIYIPDIFTTVVHEMLCQGDSLIIGPASDTSILSFKWEPADYLDDPQLLFPLARPPVSIKYVLTKQYEHCYRRDSFLIRVNEIPDFYVEKMPDGEICPGDSALIRATGDYSYEWFPKSGLSDPYGRQTYASPDTSTLYRVKATTGEGCVQEDTISVGIFPLYNLDFEPSYVKCATEVLLPDPDIPDSRIRWFNMGGSEVDSVRQEGAHIIELTTQCQQLLDTIMFYNYIYSYCRMELPNAFSPNRNGLNETYPFGGRFREIFGPECEFTEYDLIIFDRWGEIVFRSSDPEEEWDGSYKGASGSIVVFGYYLRYRETDWCQGGQELKVKKGNITLMQ
jgi:gliding motility-associated-like protein